MRPFFLYLVIFFATACFAQKHAPVKQPVVVLTFDDAEISHYSIVARLLKKYGFNATFFVTEMPLKAPADSSEYMNWQQIKALHQQGFEIGNHTGHHKNMTRLSPEEMAREVMYIEQKCIANNIPKPLSFAYPGNRSDTASQNFLKTKGYQFARAGGSRLFDMGKDSRLNIPSYTMGSNDKLKERTWTALKALQAGQILVFTVHGVPDILHPDYTTEPAVFEDFLKYMKQHNFSVIAMRDLKTHVE